MLVLMGIEQGDMDVSREEKGVEGRGGCESGVDEGE